MANRLYQQFQKTLVKEVVTVFSKFTIASFGTFEILNPLENQGIKNIFKVSEGLYEIELGTPYSTDTYNKLLSVSLIFFSSTNAGITSYAIFSEEVATTGKLLLRFFNLNTPADPAVGTTILLEIKLKNSQN